MEVSNITQLVPSTIPRVKVQGSNRYGMRAKAVMESLQSLIASLQKKRRQPVYDAFIVSVLIYVATSVTKQKF
jgi:hypothetical protein